MKKSIRITILISIFILTLGGCGSTEKQQTVKDTPHQVGQKGTISTSITSFDFNKSFEEADIVAEVTIREWIGEISEPLEKTIFRVSLNKTYKNDIDSKLKEIQIFQRGNSDYTVDRYPLFKNDDKLILYLKIAEDFDDNTYWILGGQSGVFRIVNTDGQNYVVKQVGECPELAGAKATADNWKIKNTLTKSYAVEFQNLNEFPETYYLEDMDKEIMNKKNK